MSHIVVDDFTQAEWREYAQRISNLSTTTTRERAIMRKAQEETMSIIIKETLYED